MLDTLQEIETRYQELEKQLSDPNIVSDQNRYKEVSKEYKDLERVVTVARQYQGVLKQAAEDQDVVNQNEDQELVELAGRTGRAGTAAERTGRPAESIALTQGRERCPERDRGDPGRDRRGRGGFVRG